MKMVMMKMMIAGKQKEVKKKKSRSGRKCSKEGEKMQTKK